MGISSILRISRSIFENAHRGMICVCLFIEVSVRALAVSKLCCVIKKIYRWSNVQSSTARHGHDQHGMVGHDTIRH